MNDAEDTITRLRSLGADELEALLRRRPDVLLGVAPRSLAELAQRLVHPSSLAAALRAQPLPTLQLIEATRVVGNGSARAVLADLLQGAGPDHQRDIDGIVDELVALEVGSINELGGLDLPDAIGQLFPNALGLGQPMRELLEERTVDEMRRYERGLGLERQANRRDTLAGLVGYFSSPLKVRALIAAAPAEVVDYLAFLIRDDDEADTYRYDPAEYRRRQESAAWAGSRGLLVGARYGYEWHLPAEVALALRGPGFRAPFDATKPLPITIEVDAARVEADSAVAATHFANQILGLLDHVARSPVPSLKSGGVGTRELGKLAKATGSTDGEIRLGLELANHVGLLDAYGPKVTVSVEFPQWRGAGPGERLSKLLQAWWELGFAPTQSRDAGGKARPALAGELPCSGCLLARRALIQELAAHGAGTDGDSLARAAHWSSPAAHLSPDDDAHSFRLVWREAHLLGVIAQGALSELGEALLAGDEQALQARATAVLPASADLASFGSDLTVYVAGAPSAQVSALLDSAADRESRGGAITWRFSPQSVRRAFDEGATEQGLTTALAGIATSDLPQPLRYLVSDVARRHGRLKLTTVTSCVRSDDQGLLAEVAVDRKLGKLGLRLLAPTVLASNATAVDTLTALRAAGYFPVSEDQVDNVVDLVSSATDGSEMTRREFRAIVESRFGAARGIAPEPPHEPADPATVASRLLGRHLELTPQPSGTEQALTGLTKSLSAAEIRQLAHAIDTGSPLTIDYESASGRMTRRGIDDLVLSGGSVFAWCRLRQDERIFTVSRIRSVMAV